MIVLNHERMSIVGKTSNRYDDVFKSHAVSMVVEKGRPIGAVAKDLDVSEPAFRRWVKLSYEPEDSPTIC